MAFVLSQTQLGTKETLFRGHMLAYLLSNPPFPLPSPYENSSGMELKYSTSNNKLKQRYCSCRLQKVLLVKTR